MPTDDDDIEPDLCRVCTDPDGHTCDGSRRGRRCSCTGCHGLLADADKPFQALAAELAASWEASKGGAVEIDRLQALPAPTAMVVVALMLGIFDSKLVRAGFIGCLKESAQRAMERAAQR